MNILKRDSTNGSISLRDPFVAELVGTYSCGGVGRLIITKLGN